MSRRPYGLSFALTILLAAGRCGPVETGERATGEPCSLNAECVGGICLPQASQGAATGWQDGTCSRSCLSGGCPEPGTICVVLGIGPMCQPGCADAGECRAGYVCRADVGACLPDCRLGWSCGDGWRCDADGFCQTDPDAVGAVGAACDAAVDCASGWCISAELGWPGGLCAAACSADGGSCPAGSRCAPLGDDVLCLPDCAAGGDPCREGYVCSGILEVCLPDCSLGWSCGEGYTCDEGGRCQPDPPPLAAVGEACAVPASCASGICFTAAEGWPDGMCSDLCRHLACPEGAACVPLTGVPWCLPTCADPSTCRAGYVCNDDMAACVPDCRLGWDCGSAFVCGEDGQCEPPRPPVPIGLPCGQPQDCGTDASALCLALPSGPGLPPGGGMCTLPCDAAVAPCPQDTVCVPIQQSQYCAPPCDPEGRCPPYLSCQMMRQACVPHQGRRRRAP